MQANAEQIWRKGLEVLAGRNGPVDLLPASDDDRGDYYRSRLLTLEPGGEMVVERPSVAGISTAMAIGNTLHMTLLADGTRWQGTAVVLGLEMITLNRAVSVPGLRLSPARDIRSGQRRHYYRIGLTSLDVRAFTLTPELPSNNEKPLETQLVNLSAGGVGVRVPTTVRSRDELRQGIALCCRLGLPTTTYDLAVRARLVHVEPLPDRQTYLGLQFEFDDAASERRAQDELIRFVTDLERKQLRRARGA